MNSGLVKLLKLQPRGFFRGITRKLGGTQGTIALVAGGLILLLLVVGQVAQYLSQRDDDPAATARRLDMVRAVGPLMLTAFLFLLDLSGKGLFFRPPEIDFLMPAPISRRELLLYHLCSRASVQALSGLWLALFTLRFAGSLLGGLVATVCAMTFMHLAAEMWSLLVAAAGERGGKKVRVVVWALVFGTLFFAMRSAASAAGNGDHPFASFLAGARSPVVRAITIPARPFIEAFAAESSLAALPWLGVCVGIMALTVLAILRLDVAFEEAAMTSSHRMQQRLASMRSGEGAFVASESSRSRRVPRLPRWRGAGPLAHRQLTELVRNPGAVIWSTCGMAFVVLMLLWTPSFAPAREGQPPRDFGAAAVIMTLALTTFMNQGFSFDFRRDLDRMPLLKSLPVPPWVVAAGQLVTPTLVFTLVQWTMLAFIAWRSSIRPEILLAAALAAPAWNWFSSCLDNAMFVVLPYRIDPEDPANMPFLGRLAASMFVKGICLGLVGVPVGITIAAGVAIGGAGGVALYALAWLLLMGAAVAGTFFVAAAFRGFDVSRDT